jgi:hypothetical protein
MQDIETLNNKTKLIYMKSLKEILERKDNTMVSFPKWADVMCIDLEKETIEFLDTSELDKELMEMIPAYGDSMKEGEYIYVNLR